MARAGRVITATLAVAAVLAAVSCAPGSSPSVGSPGTGAPASAGSSSSAYVGDEAPVVVQIPSASRQPTFLDPNAEPSTDLGHLRAQYLPVWTSDFDWAFPPEACGTAWELDGIAEPAVGVDIAVLGDFVAAAALSVMRYEHQLSRALAEPSPLAQLCVATAAVEPARSDALGVLQSYIDTGTRRAEPAAYPDEVWIIGASPNAALSVACVTPGYATVVGTDGVLLQTPQAPFRLQAYLLAVTRGLEDPVTDISYRVSDASHRPAQDCSGLYDWALEWEDHMLTWVAEGQIWESLGAVLKAGEICDSPPTDGPHECPRDWPR